MPKLVRWKSAVETDESGDEALEEVPITYPHTLDASAEQESLPRAGDLGKQLEEAPIKSPEDEREYRTVTLGNGLQAVLVADPTAEKSAACMAVCVGSFSEPDDIPGLAHFLEHMLFLGTAKYPGEDSFDEFLNTHGGFSNAYTSDMHTVFHFAVLSDVFSDALDRFSRFFLDPLFTASATDREINAVNNEFEDSKQDDGWRLDQVIRRRASKTHPFSRFCCGNRGSLCNVPLEKGIDVRARLLEFHKAHYSSSIMKLAIVGKESLDTLHQWAASMFGSIENLGVKRANFSELGNPLLDTQRTKCLVVPVDDTRDLTLKWHIPNMAHLHRSFPTALLSHVLGHDGAGSPSSVLRQRGWINSLEAGNGPPCETYDFDEFSIEFELTEEGITRVDDVIMVVASFIELLRALPEREWARIHAEKLSLCRAQFRFKTKESADHYATALATRLAKFEAIGASPRFLLNHGYDFPDFRMDAIHAVLDQMRASTMHVYLAAKVLAEKADLEEPVFGTKYATKPLSDQLLAQLAALEKGAHVRPKLGKLKASGECSGWLERVGDGHELKDADATAEVPEWLELAQELRLAPPNQFISTDFTLFVKDPAQLKAQVHLNKRQLIKRKDNGDVTAFDNPEAPVIVASTEHLRMWYKQDLVFLRPRLFVRFKFYTSLELTYTSFKAELLTSLFTWLLEDILVERTYDANSADLSFGVTSFAHGLAINFVGYNEKLPVLMKIVLDQIATLWKDVKEDRYELSKEAVKRQIKNCDNDSPLDKCGEGVSNVIEERHVSVPEELAALESISFKDVQRHFKMLLNDCWAEGLVFGNATRQHACHLASEFHHTLLAKSRPLRRVVAHRTMRLDTSKVFYIRHHHTNADEPCSGIQNYYQIGPSGDEMALRATLCMFVRLIESKCFTQLRTQEQLGYTVYAESTTDHGIRAFCVCIQSSDYTPDHLDRRIERFLQDFCTTGLRQLTLDEFELAAKSEIESNSVALITSGQVANHYWRELSSRRYDFQTTPDFLQALSKVSLEAVQEFANDFILMSGKHRSKLSSQVYKVGLDIPSTPSLVLRPDKRPPQESKQDAAMPSVEAESKSDAAVTDTPTDDSASQDAPLDTRTLVEVPPDALPAFKKDAHFHPNPWVIMGEKNLQNHLANYDDDPSATEVTSAPLGPSMASAL